MAKVRLAFAKAVCFCEGTWPFSWFCFAEPVTKRGGAERDRDHQWRATWPLVRQSIEAGDAVIAHYMCRLTLPGWSQNLDPFVACWMQKTLVSMLITLHASAQRVITFCDHCLIFDLATSLPGRKKQMQRQERMCWMMPGACSGDEGAVGQKVWLTPMPNCRSAVTYIEVNKLLENKELGLWLHGRPEMQRLEFLFAATHAQRKSN